MTLKEIREAMANGTYVPKYPENIEDFTEEQLKEVKKGAWEWIESLLKEEKERPAPLPPVSPFENKC